MAPIPNPFGQYTPNPPTQYSDTTPDPVQMARFRALAPGMTGTQDFNSPVDYRSQVNERIGPYQQMAAQLSSPYATMRPDSWLAQNHPKVAGILDNAFLTAGMTPGPQGPEGVGGGIARTMQGLIGANQYRRQQMIQAAMLPYQMLQPRLSAEDTLSQIQERHGMALRGESYYGSMLERAQHDERMEELNQQARDTAQQRADDLSAKYAKDPVKQLQDTGGMLGRLSVMQTPRLPQESDVDYAERVSDAYVNLYSRSQDAGAGARTTGSQDATHTFDEDKMFLENESKAVYSKLPSLQNEEQYRKNLNPTKLGEYYSNPNAYQEYVDERQMEMDKTNFNFAQYEKSGAWKNKIGFTEWLKNPNQTQSSINSNWSSKH